MRFFPALFVSALVLCALAAHAHDPSAWGGAFRTRDHGLAWLPADAGQFIGGALDIAVSPTDPNHLLYATDSRLLRSRNGGRDWAHEAPGTFVGPTLAVAFLPDGKVALASTSMGVYRMAAESAWALVALPPAALPVRRISPGTAPGQVFALGRRGVYVSRDGGLHFERSGAGTLPDEAASALFVASGAGGVAGVASGGRFWTSADGGASWQLRSTGLPAGKVETASADAADVNAFWAAGSDRVFHSRDAGRTWAAYGQPLPDAGTSIRGIAADAAGRILILATQRGALRSDDAGKTWALVEGRLPVHLQAGPLLRDPHDPSTLHIGFSLMPYQEIWRRAEQGSNLLARIDPYSLAGGAAFLVLLISGAFLLVRFLGPAYRNSRAPRSSA